MIDENNILKFSSKTTEIVNAIRSQLLAERRLCTNPDTLFLHSYDSFNLDTGEVPDDSLCRFTLEGLNHIFPYVRFDINQDNMILIEGNLTEYSALPKLEHKHESHIEYIKEIMLDVILLYQDDENKMPKDMYQWYFKT